MSQDRRSQILKAVIEIFIHTASPVGSKFLKETGDFQVSPATLRNEMAKLEKEGFLMQSHISGGRVPTSDGYRVFVDELSIAKDFKKQVQGEFHAATTEYFQNKKADQAVLDIISIITKITPNIVFATIPSSEKTFFLGFSHMITQPEFITSPQSASGIFRVLEADFFDFLSSLDIQNEIELFIGKENLLPEFESCSLLLSEFSVLGKDGFVGILGPMRMDYARNIVVLEEAKKLFTLAP